MLYYYIWKVILLLLKDVSPMHPSCPWGCQDHVTKLSAAKTRVGLLICGQGYFTVCHSVL
jgi:hypothetical protein